MKTRLIFTLLVLSNLLVTSANSDSMEFINLNNATIRSETNLWQRMRDGFRLNHKETKEVKYWEKRYANPKYFSIIMQNAAPFLYFVISEMERRGIPSELALIPIVESTYNPEAISPSAISTGMWQFVSSSGKRFGLAQTSEIDERKDIIKSTRAAIDYLVYLHDLFGTWELAIAAYNWGEGNIYNAVTKSSSKNFYDLDMRDITRQYVPKVIALANIIENPRRFGITLTDLNNNPYFGVINPPTTTNLATIMSTANVPERQFKKLNPQFNSMSYRATSAARILLPVSNQTSYLASIGKTISFPLINGSQMQMAGGDLNQDTMAANGEVTTDQINQLAAKFAVVDASSSEALVEGVVSGSNEPEVLISDNTTGANNGDGKINNETPSVKSKKQLAAKRSMVLNKEISDLLHENQAKANKAGAKKVAVAKKKAYTSYVVASGDTLYSIARKFATSVDTIKADNQLTNNVLKLNQRLLIRT